jgi:hypothetical protein
MKLLMIFRLSFRLDRLMAQQPDWAYIRFTNLSRCYF